MFLCSPKRQKLLIILSLLSLSKCTIIFLSCLPQVYTTQTDVNKRCETAGSCRVGGFSFILTYGLPLSATFVRPGLNSGVLHSTCRWLQLPPVDDYSPLLYRLTSTPCERPASRRTVCYHSPAHSRYTSTAGLRLNVFSGRPPSIQFWHPQHAESPPGCYFSAPSRHTRYVGAVPVVGVLA